jgi:hypothetical protein
MCVKRFIAEFSWHFPPELYFLVNEVCETADLAELAKLAANSRNRSVADYRLPATGCPLSTDL